MTQCASKVWLWQTAKTKESTGTTHILAPTKPEGHPYKDPNAPPKLVKPKVATGKWEAQGAATEDGQGFMWDKWTHYTDSDQTSID